MNLTKITPNKIRWIWSNSVFRKNPVRTILRMIQWECARFSNKPVRCRFDGDHEVMLRVNEGASRLTHYFGNSEPETFEFMNDYLKPGMCVIDVGANIGLNAIWAARRVSPGGQVIAIEPDPSNFNRIVENIGESQGLPIQIYMAACGANIHQSLIVCHNSQDTSRSYVRTASAIEADPTRPKMQIVTIDGIVSEMNLPKIHYLKIDVEGFEAEVLRGSMKSLYKNMIDIMQVELDNGMLQRNDSSVSDIVDAIQSAGYEQCNWDHHQKKFARLSEKCNVFNSFFVLPGILNTM